MEKERNNYPFRPSVPRPVGILVLLLMFIPPTFSGGAYLCNVAEMSGGLAVRTEDIQLASFFTSIGMCLFPPFMVRFLQARRPKQTYLWCFLMLIPLNYVCAVTTSVPVLLAACLLTGFVRIAVMLNCTFTIAPYLTGMDTLAMFTMTAEPPADVQYGLERKRTFLMPVLYFYILIISQSSNLLTAWFAYEYSWQDAYYAVIGMLLVASLLVMLTMADEEKRRNGNRVDNGARHAADGRRAVLNGLHAGVRQRARLVRLDVHPRRHCRVPAVRRGVRVHGLPPQGALLPAAGGVHVPQRMDVDVALHTRHGVQFGQLVRHCLRKIATPINNMHGAFISRWPIVGCLIGLVLSLLMVLRKARFRTIFATAFIIMASADVYMYFQYSTTGLLENMTRPTILNFTGLLMLYSLAAAFGMKSLPSRYLATYVFLMIWMRNAIAPVVGASIYSNWLTERQQHYVTRLAQTVDRENTTAAQTFTMTKLVGQAGGKGTLEAEQLATTSLKGRVTVQAAIVAMKDITGQTVLLIAGAVILVFILPYHKGETT